MSEQGEFSILNGEIGKENELLEATDKETKFNSNQYKIEYLDIKKGCRPSEIKAQIYSKIN